MQTAKYTAEQLRVEKVVSGATTKFLWDGLRYVAEFDSSNAVKLLYSGEPTAYGNVYSQSSKSGAIWTPRQFHADCIGSVRSITDSVAIVTDTRTFAAFGTSVASTGSTVAALKYCGVVGYYADTLTRSYVRARIYQLDLGAFTSRDPLMARSNETPYTYASNNPIVRFDPSGQAWQGQILSIDLKQACHPDHEVIYKFWFDNLATLPRPKPRQIWAHNRTSSWQLTTECEWKRNRFHRITLDPKRGRIDETSDSSVVIDVWDDSGIVDDRWEVTDSQIAHPFGGRRPDDACLFVTVIEKEIGFNAAVDNQNVLLPVGTNQPWSRFTPQQQRHILNARRPFAYINTIHFLFRKQHCTKCLPECVLRLLPECLECILFDGSVTLFDQAGKNAGFLFCSDRRDVLNIGPPVGWPGEEAPPEPRPR